MLVIWWGLEPGAGVNEAPVEPQSGALSEPAGECSSPYIPASAASFAGLPGMRTPVSTASSRHTPPASQ